MHAPKPMKLQPLNLRFERPDILRAKYQYGAWYGLSLGLGFAFFTWGVDSYILSAHHGLFPWLKFAIGAAACMVTGAAAGWLAARLNKPLLALPVWLASAFVFSWLSVNLPLTILPKAMSLLEPRLGGLLNYTDYDDLGGRVLLAYAWMGIFMAVAGILQLPMSEPAVFSTSIFGKLAPIFACLVLMALAGYLVDDGVVNKSMREPTVSLDGTIQFIVDHRGREMDPAEARQRHVGAFRAIDASVTPDYRLILNEYDRIFMDVHVLVKFERDWVDCQVIATQPLQCEIVGAAP